MELRQEVYYVLNHKDVDNLIREHFQKPDYDCVDNEEWNNDSTQVIVVDPANTLWYTESDQEDVQDFINETKPGKYWSCRLSSLMNELAKRGVIPQGQYLISVCW